MSPTRRTYMRGPGQSTGVDNTPSIRFVHLLYLASHMDSRYRARLTPLCATEPPWVRSRRTGTGSFLIVPVFPMVHAGDAPPASRSMSTRLVRRCVLSWRTEAWRPCQAMTSGSGFTELQAGRRPCHLPRHPAAPSKPRSSSSSPLIALTRPPVSACGGGLSRLQPHGVSSPTLMRGRSWSLDDMERAVWVRRRLGALRTRGWSAGHRGERSAPTGAQAHSRWTYSLACAISRPAGCRSSPMSGA